MDRIYYRFFVVVVYLEESRSAELVAVFRTRRSELLEILPGYVHWLTGSVCDV